MKSKIELINRIDELERAYDEAAQTANTYALKVVEANKILSKIDKELQSSPQPQDMNVRFSVLLYSQLKESLNLTNHTEGKA